MLSAAVLIHAKGHNQWAVPFLRLCQLLLYDAGMLNVGLTIHMPPALGNPTWRTVRYLTT